jgi:hypothetical protein
MSESSAESEDEIGWNDCDLCEESLDQYGTARFAELSTSEPLTFLDTGFCSWDHLSEWTARGEPTFDRWPAPELPSLPSRVGDWLADIGAFIVIAMWSILGAFGLYTLVKLVF